MATINFLYRSKKSIAPLNLRLLHSYENGTILQLGVRTKISVTKEYWTNYHHRVRIKDITMKNTQTTIRKQLAEIEGFILTEFNKAPTHKINKDWLQRTTLRYYDPNRNNEKALPVDLIGYAKYYVASKEKEWNHKTLVGHWTTINKLIRLQEKLNRLILVKDINQDFKEDYYKYCSDHSYAANTMKREIGRIKEYCRHAGKNGLKIYEHLEDLSIAGEDSGSVYLNPEELEILRLLQINNEKLANVRDLLLVSCYTGQRVSDFMRFTKDMIREQDGAQFLEFRQVKPPKKYMSVPLTKELQELIYTRGDFPRGISEQKFNDYVKEVCSLAGINQLVEGSKRINLTPKKSKATMRLVKGQYPKYELISSHIGRRSFATNYFGKIPTIYLMFITGHSRESSFLLYIRKSNTDLAIEAYRLLQ